MEQTMQKVTALSTLYRFEAAEIALSVFFRPRFCRRTCICSRVRFRIWRFFTPRQCKEYDVRVMVYASEKLCLDKRGEMPLEFL